jgi:hypothetical protein
VPRSPLSPVLFLLLALPRVAGAQELVFHGVETRPVAALATVAAATGKDAASFRVSSLRAWAEGLEPTFTGGTLAVCEGEPSDREALDAALAELEESVSFFDTDKATDAFARFEATLRCQTAPVEDHIVARAYFLRGFVAFTSGDEATAADAYAAARAMDGALRFDANLPSDSLALFEAAEAGVSTVRVEIRPTPDRVWLDGEERPYTADGIPMVPGRHVLAIDSDSDATVILQVESAGAVVLPALLGDDPVAQVEAPRSRANLLQMLAYADVDKAWVTTLDRTWVYERNRLRELGVEAPTIEEPRRRGRFTPAGVVVAGAGLVLGGVGAALFATRDDGSAVPGVALMGAGGAALVTGASIVVADQIDAGPTWGIAIGGQF